MAADRALGNAERRRGGCCCRRRHGAATLLLHFAVAAASCASVYGATCIAPKYELIPQHVGCLPRSQFYIETPSTSLAESDLVTAEFNAERAAATAQDMQILQWDRELAALAQRWAENCSGVRDESLTVPARFTAVGQAVVIGYSDWRTAVLAMKYSLDFVYGSATAMNYTKVVNYAQVMWASANKIGCGYATCLGLGHVYVCNFAPGYPTKSNFSKPYINGTQCGACPQTCNSQSLCDCLGVTCQNDGQFQLNSCTCKCKYPHYTGSSCDLNCSYSDPPECASKAASQCRTASGGGVSVQCPHLCQLCPYADPGYRPSSTTSVSPTNGVAAGGTLQQPTGQQAATAAVSLSAAVLLVWQSR